MRVDKSVYLHFFEDNVLYASIQTKPIMVSLCTQFFVNLSKLNIQNVSQESAHHLMEKKLLYSTTVKCLQKKLYFFFLKMIFRDVLKNA